MKRILLWYNFDINIYVICVSVGQYGVDGIGSYQEKVGYIITSHYTRRTRSWEGNLLRFVIELRGSLTVTFFNIAIFPAELISLMLVRDFSKRTICRLYFKCYGGKPLNTARRYISSPLCQVCLVHMLKMEHLRRCPLHKCSPNWLWVLCFCNRYAICLHYAKTDEICWKMPVKKITNSKS